MNTKDLATIKAVLQTLTAISYSNAIQIASLKKENQEKIQELEGYQRVLEELIETISG